MTLCIISIPPQIPIPTHIDAAVVKKAEGARKATLRGTDSKTGRKSPYQLHFPFAAHFASPLYPKYPPHCCRRHRPRTDAHSIIKFPINTESAMRCIEDHNTLVFACDPAPTSNKSVLPSKPSTVSKSTVATL